RRLLSEPPPRHNQPHLARVNFHERGEAGDPSTRRWGPAPLTPGHPLKTSPEKDQEAHKRQTNRFSTFLVEDPRRNMNSQARMVNDAELRN
ncbi:hypothetical protein AVEN_105265-1, partial [Araneus ventricosus]